MNVLVLNSESSISKFQLIAIEPLLEHRYVDVEPELAAHAVRQSRKA